MLKRLLSAALASVVVSLFGMVAQAQQLIEIRFYHFRSAESANKFDAMMKNAALPVITKQGIGPVGVFQVRESAELGANARVTIVAYDSMQKLLDLRDAYAQDPNFWPVAQEYLLQEKGNPAYDRVESMLLESLSGMPQLKVPGNDGGKQRLFELRTYKSENEIQGLLKVKMFNEGEIQLFSKVGLNAVFYGDAIVASNLPQMTYMLVHDDETSQQKAWKTFIDHPEWKSLSSEEQYQIIKLQITKHMLTATDYSQIK